MPRASVPAEGDIQRYRARLSGPLLDRIDLHVTLSPVPLRALGATPGAESSTAVRARVESARGRQRIRFRGTTLSCNAGASGRTLLAQLEPAARELLDSAAESLSLSARAYHRVVKVARTIADLPGVDAVERPQVAEALRYRPAR